MHVQANLGSPADLMIIMAIALVVFGPKKLPEIGRGIGNALREFNKARNDFMETINSEVDHPPPPRYSDSEHTPLAADGTPGPVEGTVTYQPDGHPVTTAGAHKLEYPQPLPAEHADALPYGSDFHAVDGDSQPSIRTVQPETHPVTTAASGTAHVGEGRACGHAYRIYDKLCEYVVPYGYGDHPHRGIGVVRRQEIPELAKGLGQGMKEFKSAMHEEPKKEDEKPLPTETKVEAKTEP